MKAKKLWAVALSVAMVLTSFTVPTFADEVVEPVEEVIVEEVSEEASVVEEEPAYEVTLEEVTEEAADSAIETEVSIMSEGQEGDTYYVLNADDIAKYLGNASNTSKSKGKYILASKNAGKDVYLKLAQDVTIDSDTIKAIPGDRQLHIDLNGHTLEASAATTIELKEMTGDFKGWQSLYIENSAVALGHFGDNITITVKGTEGTPIKQSLLNVGTGVCSDANVTVDGGIISYDKNSTIELGKTVNVLSGLANISADVKGTLTGKNIALSNASINASATVTLNDGSSITGSNACNAVIETIGNVTINDDGKSLELNVTAGTATMTGGEIKAVEVNGATAKFVMNGGRIDSPTIAVNVVSGTATLSAGIVHGNSRAVSGTFNDTTSTKKYIIDGVEADAEEVRTSGDIKDADDLEYAFTHGGDWVLADDVTESNALTLGADLTLTNKSGYVIDMDGNDITVGAHKLTLDVNIINGQINASAAGAKLIILGGKYVAPTGSDNNMITTDDLANKVEIRGGVIAGSEGTDYVYGGELPDASDCSAANCAINDGAGNYNNAAVVKNGKEVVEFSQETAKAYILLNSATTVNISDVLGGLGAKGITATGLATVDAAFRSSHNGTSSNVTGLTYNSLSGDINLAAATEGTDVLDATIYYTFYGDSPADAVEVASATVKIDCTTKSDADIANLANEYNATLEYTSGTMNAYANEYKIYFDFHRVGNEGKLIAVAEPSKLEPTNAVINVRKGSTFSKYFANTNDLYPVEYDSEKDMYYVKLEPVVEGSGSPFETTKLAMDEVKKFSNLSINVGFADPTAPGTLLFSVPMTKYAYSAVTPEKGNVEQEYSLKIDQTEPMLTFEEVSSDAGKAITVNPAYENNKSYIIDFTEMPEVEDSKLVVHPGYFTGQDIIDASDDNVDVDALYMQSKSGKFNSNGSQYTPGSDLLEIYYMGSAGSEEEEEAVAEGEEATVRVMAEYKDYVGTHALDVPVNILAASPKAKLNVSSFTVAKDEAVSNIPLEFSSTTPDDLGAISYIEVVKNAKMFSVVQPTATPVIKTTNGKKFTYDGFKLAVQKISDKKGISGTIKVHYNGIKDKDGAEYVSTYNVTAKPVEPGKFKISAKSSEVLYIGTASKAEAKITLKTNPDYANGSVTIAGIDVNSKSAAAASAISVSVNGMDLIVRKNTTTPIPKDISAIKIKVNYVNANDEYMCTDNKGARKDQVISVKINKNESVAPTKSTVDVIMNACTSSQKLYYNNTIEADNTAKRLTKTVSFGGKNYVLDSVEGTGDGAEKLFTVVSAGNGKVKIAPKLDALKSGLITVGDNFALKLNLVEAGKGDGNTAVVNVNIKIEKDPTKFKVNAKIDTKGIKLSSSAAQSGAKFTIKTVKPFYGMKIKSVKIDTTSKTYKSDADYFEIQSINGGQGFTASDINGGTDYSDFKVVFKNGKVPTKVSGSGVKSLITGSQKAPIVVEYENGLKAYLTLTVNITK